jgi:hypothetical protein
MNCSPAPLQPQGPCQSTFSFRNDLLEERKLWQKDEQLSSFAHCAKSTTWASSGKVEKRAQQPRECAEPVKCYTRIARQR